MDPGQGAPRGRHLRLLGRGDPPVKGFQFTIRDSFANGNACANIGTFSAELEDGTLADTDLIATYRVNEAGG